LLLFFFPVPAKVLVVFLALLNLLSAAGAGGNIAYIAHVGGMGAGWLMIRGQPRLDRWMRGWRERDRARRERERVELRRRMDDILDKMSREGRESLSQEEWRTLLEQSKRLRDKRDGGTT
jgi:hypothetical protein